MSACKTFTVTVLGGILAASLSAEAQTPPKIPRIGFLIWHGRRPPRSADTSLLRYQAPPSRSFALDLILQIRYSRFQCMELSRGDSADGDVHP